jgi:hypothetical protein
MKIHRFDGAGIFECIARATTSGRRAEVLVMNTMPMAISLSDDLNICVPAFECALGALLSTQELEPCCIQSCLRI